VEDGTQDEDYSQHLHRIFRMIWLTDKFREAEIGMAARICRSQVIPWHDKSLIVSSLTLSLIRHFDVQKVNLLFDFYEQGEQQVWQRALIGLFLALYFHDQRLAYYPEILDRLEAAQEVRKLEKHIEAIVIQFLKARETEKVTQKIREEIMPEMMKIKSTLEEKLDLEEILSSKTIDEENPEWETVFEDTPDLYGKIEEFSMLQMEGADVFLSAFAMLKRFPFFNEISNWFLPFHRDNEEVLEGFAGEDKEFDVGSFVEGLERSGFLCNSDKYSFCLNVRHMPEQQKTMMMQLFNMELKAMNEMQDSDDLVDDTRRDKSIYTQYLQDLYRFFKLYPFRHEFDDIFETEFDFEDSNLFTVLIKDRGILRNIGEFYFEKNYWERAIEVFTQLGITEKNAELFEKTGFSYQKLGAFDKALEYYHKAELFDKEKPWTLKKIAYCARKSGDYEEALKYYRAAEKLEADNLFIQTFLGHTMMDMEDYEGALKYYFKVEYNAPENHKIHRPIAWCSFLLGKFDQAEKYFTKVIDKEGNRNDFMNMGHVAWCKGNRGEAIYNYRRSLEKSDFDFDWFGRVLEEDAVHLLKHGIKSFDLPLMVDYLRLGP
jgi:tetratricopeptide (TPR) repeat protein